jgi:CHAT domain-containing protein
VIHFAGHALSSEYRPADTSIVLTGADGIMSVKDIASLRLRGSSTVVLAACSTARGRVRRFEGTLSVARAFLASGAPSVIATLWPIDDLDAARFFPRLHEYLARGLSASEALRATQLDSIRNSESPSMWAAVQTIGS